MWEAGIFSVPNGHVYVKRKHFRGSLHEQRSRAAFLAFATAEVQIFVEFLSSTISEF